MKYNLLYLEEIKRLSDEECFIKKKKRIKKNKMTKGYLYQYYNQLCVCIIRITETVEYLEHFSFKKTNVYGQAFDFYEFINCSSIIKECVDILFKIFDLDFKKYYKKKAFKTSNITNVSDIDFFNFMRSATTVHPANTTAHYKITKHKLEVYPYLTWCLNSTFLFEDKPKEADLVLLSWNCKTNCRGKRYYLKSSEFDKFIKNILVSLKNLVPVLNTHIKNYKRTITCKRLKKLKSFKNWGEYCLYLRRRIKTVLTAEDYPDGGLLIASHMLTSPIISNDFKIYIKNKIRQIRKKMITDITKINYNEIFKKLSLNSILVDNKRGTYISEKFYNYLYDEAIREIDSHNYIDFKKELSKNHNPQIYSNRAYSVILLLEVKDIIYKNNELEKAISYADLYELTLESIFLKHCINKN